MGLYFSLKKSEKNQKLQDLTGGESSGFKPQLVQKSVSSLALLMSLGTFLSRILGFVRDRLIVQFYDVQVADAFYAAFRLPNFLRILLGEGALSVAFLPAYVDLKRDPEAARKLAGTVWGFLTLLSATISVLGVFYMQDLLPYLVDAENFLKTPNKYENTLLFSQIMFGYLFLVSQFAFFMSMLNSHDEFFYPGLAPALFNLLVILVIVFKISPYGVEGDSLPLAIMVGGLGQAILVYIKCVKLKILPRINFFFLSPEFTKVLKRAAPSLIGLGAVQFLGVMNLGYASSLDAGSITYIYLADRLLELPQSILAISLGAALLPRLTAYWSEDNKTGFLNQMFETTQMYYFLAIPSAVGLVVLAKPLVALLFATKNISAEGLEITSKIVQLYSITLLVGGTSRLVMQGFYAVKNTAYPALGSCLIILIHYFLAPLFMSQMGLLGLIVSSTLSAFISLVLTFITFQFLVTKMNLGQFFSPLPKIIILNTVTFLVSYLTYYFWVFYQDHFLFKNLILIFGISMSVLLYFLVAWYFNFTQVLFLNRIKNRFKF